MSGIYAEIVGEIMVNDYLVLGMDNAALFNSANLRCALVVCFKTAFISTSCLSGKVGI